MSSSVRPRQRHAPCSRYLRAAELRDGGASGREAEWPPSADCAACFNVTAGGGATRGGERGDWEPQSVFEFLQSVYCFESDTYVCAGFDNPSQDAKSRQAHQTEVARRASA